MPSSDRPYLLLVPAERVPQVKDRVAPVLADPTGRRAWRWEEYEPALTRGELQLWLIGSGEELLAALLTELAKRPQGLVGVIRFIAGAHRDRWLHLLPALEAWFRARGCVEAHCWARRGWERLLGDWKKTHILLEKRL